MTETYVGWALLVGLALGGALVWLAVGRIPRGSADISPEERPAEAEWISGQLKGPGRMTPEVVEQVLDLHTDYLAGGRQGD